MLVLIKMLPLLSCLSVMLLPGAGLGLAADAPAAAETIRLWPDDAPGALGTSDHDIPVVAWWPAKDAKQPTAAIVVCPGGGYGGLADHEGSDYARWLNSQGISAFVLRYRLGSKGYRHPVMLGDVSRAMRLVRAEYARLGIDPARVGVMGTSTKRARTASAWACGPTTRRSSIPGRSSVVAGWLSRDLPASDGRWATIHVTGRSATL